MDEAGESYRDRVAGAIMQAIHDASVVEIDGERHAVFNMALICDAITLATAVMLDQTPAAQTAKATREVADMMARDIRRRVREVRAIYDATGKRPIEGELIQPN